MAVENSSGVSIPKIAGSLIVASAAAIAGLQTLEKQELVVYADKLAYGLPTYCSGTTLPTRRVGERIPKAECDAIDKATVTEYGLAVLSCIPANKFDQNSFDAFTLFAVNVGKTGACKSRAAQFMRAGERDLACRAMATGPDGRPAWSYAGGKYVQGLQNRRQFEMKWCLRRSEPAAAVAASQTAPELVATAEAPAAAILVPMPLPELAEPTVTGEIEKPIPLPWWRTIFGASKLS